MPEENKRLLLLEILIDSIKINYDKVDLDGSESSDLKETCVRFRVLNNIMLAVSEEDFCKTSEYKIAEIPFKSGKSVLFSLRNLPRTLHNLNINVSVSRAREEKSPLFIGKTCIPLGSSFTNIILARNEECSKVPRTKTIKDTYDLYNNKCQNVGVITVFVRLSCFGSIIVTQFEVGSSQSKSFHFKGATHLLCKSDYNESKKRDVPTKEIKKTREPSKHQLCQQLFGHEILQPPIKTYGQEVGCKEENLMNFDIENSVAQAGILGMFEGYTPGILSHVGMTDYRTLEGQPGLFQSYQGPLPGIMMGYSSKPMMIPQNTYNNDSSSEEEKEEDIFQKQVAQLRFCECDIPLPPGLFNCPPRTKSKKKRHKKKCPFELPINYYSNHRSQGYPFSFGYG